MNIYVSHFFKIILIAFKMNSYAGCTNLFADTIDDIYMENLFLCIERYYIYLRIIFTKEKNEEGTLK